MHTSLLSVVHWLCRLSSTTTSLPPCICSAANTSAAVPSSSRRHTAGDRACSSLGGLHSETACSQQGQCQQHGGRQHTHTGLLTHFDIDYTVTASTAPSRGTHQPTPSTPSCARRRTKTRPHTTVARASINDNLHPDLRPTCPSTPSPWTFMVASANAANEHHANDCTSI